MSMDKWLLIASLTLSGCATGIATKDYAYGVAIGDAEISACAPASTEALAGVVDTKGSVPECPRVKGGTVSITGGGILTAILSFISGWVLR